MLFLSKPEDDERNDEGFDDKDTAFRISCIVRVGVYMLTRPLTLLTMLIDFPTRVSIFRGDPILLTLISTRTKSRRRHPRNELLETSHDIWHHRS